jgi:ABC-type amino acid transport substrate-binding protein
MTIKNASRGLIAVAIALAWLLPAPTLAQDLQGTLKKIKDSGTIVIGYREQSLPFSFRGDDGKPTGYSIDLCQRIVTGIQQQLKLPKLDVKWVAVTVDSRMTAVVNGTIDLECGSTTSSLSRQEQVDFSNMTFVDGGSLLVKTTSNFATFQDLGGKKIGIIPGTTTEGALRTVLQKTSVTATIVPVTDHLAGPGGAGEWEHRRVCIRSRHSHRARGDRQEPGAVRDRRAVSIL